MLRRRDFSEVVAPPAEVVPQHWAGAQPTTENLVVKKGKTFYNIY